MFEKYLGMLKEKKKVYDITLVACAGLAMLILHILFTLPVSLVPVSVIVIIYLILKDKLPPERKRFGLALSIQVAQAIWIFLTAFFTGQLLVRIMDVLILVFGVYWFAKRPSLKSGGFVVIYNSLLAFTYILGIKKALMVGNPLWLRSQTFYLTITLLTVGLMICGLVTMRGQAKDEKPAHLDENIKEE